MYFNGIDRKFWNWKIFRFGLVGGTGSLLNFLILFVFTDIVGLYYLFSACIALAVNSVFNYLFNSWYTFGESRGVLGYAKYMMATMLSRGIHMLILFVLTDIFGVYYMISAVIAILLCFAINYFLSTKYVWNKE